jgi:antitoxin VapB
LTYPRRVAWNKALFSKATAAKAIRLPKAVALPDDVTWVDVIAIGRIRIITPAGQAWESWFDGENVTSSFMNEREQPADQEREAF